MGSTVTQPCRRHGIKPGVPPKIETVIFALTVPVSDTRSERKSTPCRPRSSCRGLPQGSAAAKAECRKAIRLGAHCGSGRCHCRREPVRPLVRHPRRRALREPFLSSGARGKWVSTSTKTSRNFIQTSPTIQAITSGNSRKLDKFKQNFKKTHIKLNEVRYFTPQNMQVQQTSNPTSPSSPRGNRGGNATDMPVPRGPHDPAPPRAAQRTLRRTDLPCLSPGCAAWRGDTVQLAPLPHLPALVAPPACSRAAPRGRNPQQQGCAAAGVGAAGVMLHSCCTGLRWVPPVRPAGN